MSVKVEYESLPGRDDEMIPNFPDTLDGKLAREAWMRRPRPAKVKRQATNWEPPQLTGYATPQEEIAAALWEIRDALQAIAGKLGT
jgi:hypothetical protein